MLLFWNSKNNNFNFSGEDYKELGKLLGSIVSSVSLGLENFDKEYKVNTKDQDYPIQYKDLNTNRGKFKLISNKLNGKDTALLLLFVLSSVNFIRFILMNELPHDNTYLFKVKYIAVYYALNNINRVLKNNIYKKFNDTSIYLNLSKLVQNIEIYNNTIFRNCMMHYEFIDKGEFLIDDKYLNHKIPLFGLVETYFEGRGFDEINNILTDKIIEMSDCIEKIYSSLTYKLKNLD